MTLPTTDRFDGLTIIEALKRAQERYELTCRDSEAALEQFKAGKISHSELEAEVIIRDAAFLDWKQLYALGERMLAELRGAE